MNAVAAGGTVYYGTKGQIGTAGSVRFQQTIKMLDKKTNFVQKKVVMVDHFGHF